MAEKKTLLYLLFEHKSQVERWTVFQLLGYMMRIWESVLASEPPAKTLPLHHSQSVWTAATSFQELFDPELMRVPELRRFVPSFEVVLDDVSHVSDEALRQRALTEFGVLALLFLRDGRATERLLEGLRRWQDLLRQLTRQPGGQRALVVLFRYLTAVAPDLDAERLHRAMVETLPEQEEVMPTLAEKWMEQGREQGLEQGREQGREQGLQCQRSLIRRQLEKKFGPLNSDASARLDAAETDQLEQYADRLLDAATLAEVFGE